MMLDNLFLIYAFADKLKKADNDLHEIDYYDKLIIGIQDFIRVEKLHCKDCRVLNAMLYKYIKVFHAIDLCNHDQDSEFISQLRRFADGLVSEIRLNRELNEKIKCEQNHKI